MNRNKIINVCLVGALNDSALLHCKAVLLKKQKLQCVDHLQFKFVFVSVDSPLLLAPLHRKNVALPYAGRFKAAHYLYTGYNIRESDEQLRTDQYVNYAHRLQKEHNKVVCFGPNEWEDDQVLQAKAQLELVRDESKTNVIAIIIDGTTVPIDLLVQSQNNIAFSPSSLDKALQESQMPEQMQAEASFSTSSALTMDSLLPLIPRAPTSAAAANSNKNNLTTLPLLKNAFVCGEAAAFLTPASCAVSGIYVALYVKTFLLKVCEDLFTVVTSNEKKFAEYVNILGPVHRMNPKSVHFMINTETDAMYEGFKKNDLVKLQLKGGKQEDIIHADSHYWFIDSNSLKIESNEGAFQEMLKQYRGFSKEPGDRMSLKCDVLRESPGTDVENWVRIMDKFDTLDEENDGKHASWRCSVILTRRKPAESDFLTSTQHNGLTCGRLAFPPRGKNGFGFDSRFAPSTRNSPYYPAASFPERKTFAEMTSDEKDEYSCRADGILSSLYWLFMKDEHDKDHKRREQEEKARKEEYDAKRAKTN